MTETTEDGFYARVYAAIARIPAGCVTTYGQVALMVERPRGARLVGWAMRTAPEGLPWYRVVRADGSMAVPGQQALLADEGVTFTLDGRVDMAAHQW